MKVSTDLFLMGLALAWGPCFYSCTPIVLSYLAGTKQGWLRGLVNVLVFSAARVIAYVIVSVIAFLIGHMVIRNWYEIGQGQVLYYAAGAVTIILGILLLFNNDLMHSKFCSRFINPSGHGNLWGITVLGFVIGVAPCIPMFGAINYVVFESKGIMQAIFYAGCFGMGTVLGPLIPLGVAAGGIGGFAGKVLRKFDVFGRLCGVVMIYLGIRLILKQI